MKITGIVADWEGQSGITLAEAQHEAVLSALMHGILVLTGGPGTGGDHGSTRHVSRS